MYTEYFGFAEKPFKLKADPLVFYVNPGYEKTYDEIGRGIHEQHGPIVLTGAAGTGKTSLLHICMAGAEEQIRFVVFAQTTLSFSDILDHLSSELGLTGSSPDEAGKSAAIMDFLAHQLPGDTVLALVIDDAHNLDQDTIDKLLGLYQSQAPDKRRLQILLIGLPELKHKLHYHQIGVRCQLEPLADSEISSFIEQQLHKAGCQRDDLFPAAAIQRIAAYAKGVPRHITALCDTALLNASLIEHQTITPEIVEQAAQHCFLSDVNPAAGQNDDAIEYITPADVAQVFAQTRPPRITEEPAAAPATEQTSTASDTGHHQPGASLIERLHADSPVSLGAGAAPTREPAAHPEPASTAVAPPSQPAVGERTLPAATETAIAAPKDGAATTIEPPPSARHARLKTRRHRRRFPKKLFIVFLFLLAGAGGAAMYKKPEWFGLERAQIVAAYSRAQEYAQKALAKTRAWIEQFQDTTVPSSDSPAPGRTQEPAQLTPSTAAPESQPEPAPEPQPEPELPIQPEPEPAPAPAPQPVSTPAPEPQAAPEPALAPAPEPAPQAGPEPAPAPQPEPQFQPEPTPQIQPEPMPESQAEPEPQFRPASTPLLPEQSPAPEKESATVSDAKDKPLTTLPTIAETPGPVTTAPEEPAQQQTERITEETAALSEPASEQQTPVLEALFARAEQQLSAQRLTTPTGDNALETYLEILDLSPDNDRALAGMEAIKNTYRQWADSAAQQQAWGKARDYYEKALSLDPDDSELKQSLQQLPR